MEELYHGSILLTIARPLWVDGLLRVRLLLLVSRMLRIWDTTDHALLSILNHRRLIVEWCRRRRTV